LERREQVFVSSTYLDLKEERQAVIQGLLEADCIPAGMELFPASDSDKWDLIKGVINDSDYYIVIIGGRYGSVDPAGDISFTEMEFDYAVSAKKPIMAFLHGEPGSIPARKTELDPIARDRLEKFRSKAEQRPVKYWTTPHDLDGAVAKSLIKIRKSHPAVGWVRGNYAMTPEVQRDLAELRARVSELTQQLQATRNVPRFSVPEGLAQGDDIYLLRASLRYWSVENLNKREFERHTQHKKMRLPVTWNTVFARIAPALLDEADEETIKADLLELALELATHSTNQAQFPNDYGREVGFDLDPESTKDVVVQLFALGLMTNGIKKRPINDIRTYWRLTDLGRDNLMILRAIRRGDSP
jgi:hypothetical protein